MIFFLNSIFIFFLICGIICTLAPKMRGTAIILGTLIVYGFITDFKNMETQDFILLCTTSLTVEIASSILRFYLTKQYPISRSFAINTAMGKCAGIVAANAVFGSTIGIVLWEFIANRTVMPIHLISKILLSLTLIALGRVISGIFMAVFAIYFIFE